MRQIADFLKGKNRFLVVSHVRPDGDAVGSSLGLALALRSAGRQVDVVSADPMPHDYRRLPGAGTVLVQSSVSGDYDAAVILECSEPARTGVAGLENCFLVNIDHHESAREYAQLNWIDTSFGAVGQMVFRLIGGLGIPVTPDIAANLYVALVTDTGNFQFGNTTAVELEDAARLVRLGARPAEICEQIYHGNRSQKIHLLGLVLSTLQLDPTRRMAWVQLTRGMLEQTGANPGDTEGIVNHLLTIDTVQVAAFFKEESEDSFKVSLRSKGDLDVSTIARSYQGGGHRNAAGFTVRAGYGTASGQVLARLEKLLDGRPA